VVLLYTAVTLVYFWPLPRLWQDHIGPDLGDPVYCLWALKWGVHQIRLGLPDVWNANIFYPARGVLTYSEHLLGPAAQLVLFLEIVPNAIAGYNFLFLSSFVASALAVCWVLRQSGLSWTAAVLGGWMYAFSCFRLSHVAHLQVLLAQWILFYLLNLTGGCYFAYMIHFALLGIFISRSAAEGRALFSVRSLRVLLPVVVVAGAAGAALFLPYVRIARAQGLSRPQTEIEEYGARLASYFSPSGVNLYFGEAANRLLHSAFEESADLFRRPENSLFAGFLPTILFFVGAFAAWRGSRGRPADPWARGLVLSGLICFALSFAGVYVPLARVVPGLSGMRVPARFYAFVSLTVVYFAARGVDVLLRRIPLPGSWARAALASGLALVLVVELAPRSLPWEGLPREEELPKAYAWLRDEPSIKGLIELPIYGDGRESYYVYSSTLHWKPIANGYSGYTPGSYIELARRIRFLPNADDFDLLREMEISHLVVHARRPGRAQAVRRWEAEFAHGPERQVERVYQEPGITIYRLLKEPGPRQG
jgi:hypothetical protein